MATARKGKGGDTPRSGQQAREMKHVNATEGPASYHEEDKCTKNRDKGDEKASARDTVPGEQTGIYICICLH